MMRNDPIKHAFIWPTVIVVLAISIFRLTCSLTTVDRKHLNRAIERAVLRAKLATVRAS
jgi:uncharacterized membrane protein